LPTIKQMGDTLHEIGAWLHDLEAQLGNLAGFGGGTTPAATKRRGRPPGRKAVAVAAPSKRGRIRRNGLGDEIIAYLKAAKGPSMPKAIREALKANPTSVSTTLNRLAKAGHVKRDSKGRGWTA
jgi:hypothetical protein